MPPSRGDITQEIAIVPIMPQFTVDNAISVPPKVIPNTIELPTTPPIIAWVVETGRPFLVANNNQNAAAISAESMT